MVDNIFCPYGMMPDFVDSLNSGPYQINLLNEFFSPNNVEYKECEGTISFGEDTKKIKVFISPVYLRYSKTERVSSEARVGWKPKRVLAVGSVGVEKDQDLWRLGCFFLAYKVLCNIVYASRFVNPNFTIPRVGLDLAQLRTEFASYLKRFKTDTKLQNHINKTLKLGEARGYYILRDRKSRISADNGKRDFQQHYFLVYSGKLGNGLVYSSYPGLPTAIPDAAKVTHMDKNGLLHTKGEGNYNIFHFFGGGNLNRDEKSVVVTPPLNSESELPTIIEEVKPFSERRMEGWGYDRY